MERPQAAELDAILATVEEIRQAELRIRDLKVRLSQEAHALAHIEDKPTRIASAVYAYWFAPEASASDLTFGAIGQKHPSKLLKYVGAQPTGVHCERCEAELEIGSREQMKQVLAKAARGYPIPEGYRILCSGCWEAVFEARSDEWERAEQLLRARASEIAKLEYADYLQTADWVHQRVRYLGLLLDLTKSPLECEACGAAEELGLYHKTLERLGRSDDLILLCVTCADALMGAGRLAGRPTERNRVSETFAKRLEKQVLD